MVQAVAATLVRKATQALIEAVESRGLKGAGSSLHSLVIGQGCREASLAEDLAPTSLNLAQEELLGLAVLEVEAGRSPDGLEAAGLVECALEARLIHEALDQKTGVVDASVDSTDALAREPTDPLITGLDVKGGAGKEEDRTGWSSMRAM